MPSPTPRAVVVAGGGVAALETLLALRHHAADHVSVTLLTATREYVTRAMTVAEPFARGRALRHPIAQIAHDAGAAIVPSDLARVDAKARVAVTDAGDELHYESLVVATGARMRRPFAGAVTFGIDDPEYINGLLLDLEEDYEDAVAFVVPPGPTWPLPVYELALMTMAEVRGMGRNPRITIVTPEPAPLAAFGWEVSVRLEDLLAEARIAFAGSSSAWLDDEGVLHVTPGPRILEGHRIVALPVLEGPATTGLPSTSAGFHQTDDHGRLRGVFGVHAAGDAAAWPVKHGGLAAQQADAVAEQIASDAGARLDPQPFAPVLRGALLTGERRTYLRAHTGERGRPSAISPQLLWWPPAKVSARFLAPYLFGEEHEELVDLGERTERFAVEVPFRTDLLSVGA